MTIAHLVGPNDGQRQAEVKYRIEPSTTARRAGPHGRTTVAAQIAPFSILDSAGLFSITTVETTAGEILVPNELIEVFDRTAAEVNSTRKLASGLPRRSLVEELMPKSLEGAGEIISGVLSQPPNDIGHLIHAVKKLSQAKVGRPRKAEEYIPLEEALLAQRIVDANLDPGRTNLGVAKLLGLTGRDGLPDPRKGAKTVHRLREKGMLKPARGKGRRGPLQLTTLAMRTSALQPSACSIHSLEDAPTCATGKTSTSIGMVDSPGAKGADAGPSSRQ